MTEEQIKAKAQEHFPNDEFKQQAVIDSINWATKELQTENKQAKELLKMFVFKGIGNITPSWNELIKNAESFLKEFENDRDY